MSDKNVNPKISTGKDEQAEHHNTDEEKGYVKKPEDDSAKEKEDGDYLKNKWKQISKDFEKTYNLNVSESEFKGESFSETLKNLENKTGKSRANLEDEIRNWKNS